MNRKSIPCKLTATEVKQAKPKIKAYKMSDGAGMFLLVNPNGSKYWRMKYNYNGREKLLSIGVYPDVTLSKARKIVMEARSNLVNGIDPSRKKREDKISDATNTFKNIAIEWVEKQSGQWSKGQTEKVLKSLEADVFKAIGSEPIHKLTAQDILLVVRKVEGRGALDVASRVKQRISAIFRYAMCTGRATHNPVDALVNVIKTSKVKHRPALPAEALPDFLKKLDKYQGSIITKLALQLLVLTFVRPGELRGAEWSEFNIDKAEWRIPAARSKMKDEHIVPLSYQALEVIKQIKEVTGKYKLLFTGANNIKKTMSENTLTYAIRKRLGFDATAHGFRSTASTVLNEKGFNCDVIERQLAHSERNKVRAAYNHSLYLKDRKTMMQWWADYLDKSK